MAEGPDVRLPPASAHFNAKAAARDWITIWQSELAAMASDREGAEAWVRMVGIWAAQAHAAAQFLPGAGDGPPGRTRSRQAAGAAAAAAAPDARDAAIERLAERVAELERRLAGQPGLDEPAGGG